MQHLVLYHMSPFSTFSYCCVGFQSFFFFLADNYTGFLMMFLYVIVSMLGFSIFCKRSTTHLLFRLGIVSIVMTLVLFDRYFFLLQDSTVVLRSDLETIDNRAGCSFLPLYLRVCAHARA